MRDGARGIEMRRIEYSLRVSTASINSIFAGSLRTFAISALRMPFNAEIAKVRREPQRKLVLGGSLKRQDRRRVAVVSDLRGRVAVVVSRCFCFVNVREPLARRLALALGNFEEEFLNFLGNRPTTAPADCYPIDGTNRRDLSRRAREEQFVSNVERRALNGAFFNNYAEFLTDLNHAVARDAGKNRRGKWRRQNNVSCDGENVLTRTF